MKGGSGLCEVLDYQTVGITLAIVRRARDIFWAAVGLMLMTSKSLSQAAVWLKKQATRAGP